MSNDLHQWFIEEIHPHERALLRFLARVWPVKSEVEDLCQETYIRVYESAALVRPESPRGFLFATARHLLTDRIRHDRVVSIETTGDLDSLNVILDKVTPEQQLNAQQELWRLAQVFGTLPTEYRELIWMVKVEQLSQKEVASRLGITTKAVERRLARALCRLEDAYLKGSGVGKPVDSAADSENGSDHG